ncbi:fimbrial protein [Serratia entomophila]|uniref:fimbrial protein n=1 Tax=Serratia entomophila TaxID=42906 RepID=UPI002177B752|nr:fimbrial protein [Serratia entomophila]CAI0952765.1 putative fimbrial-like adhesin protein StcD [Serratia entomophila]CAI1646985.1 putative fimbrial-like adhesin protein StcD [Serratia entomophila]CAI1675320.1 putative fimbrial-like adhesin protein StcD [Serratia entomophila]CAI1685277.1 putative fimbrial-like adhesin protein StcD [Serratia entomophila]CAI1767813.1 putative fimbrial-like adhesin protein StcD [Serratia entomophila]
MIRIFSLLLLCGLFSGYGHASCYGSGIQYASPIFVDLSDKLTEQNPVWQGSFFTQYAGSFSCSTGNSTFGYTRILSTDSSKATILGFSDGKYWVRAEIVNNVDNKDLKGTGRHSAAELNVPMDIRFTLVNKTGTSIAGDTARLNDVLFVTDLSGMSLWEIILWPAKQLLKILTWLFNGFNWPYDQRDMYGQPMNIKYAPKMTTCSFDNAGLAVKLPTVGLSQVGKNSRTGLTPFTLNLSCQNMRANGTSDRAINMFLSSNNLQASDNTVLIDKNAGAATGIGIRLVKMDAPNSPVIMSLSNIERGSATSLFNVPAGGALNSRFTIGMAAYYYPYNLAEMTSGAINSSATLNIIYK